GIVTTTDLVKICSIGSDSEMRRICDQILTRMEKSSEF
ncbi:MAG: signal transduction protein, partial [Nitrosarchaeum sp.]